MCFSIYMSSVTTGVTSEVSISEDFLSIIMNIIFINFPLFKVYSVYYGSLFAWLTLFICI